MCRATTSIMNSATTLPERRHALVAAVDRSDQAQLVFERVAEEAARYAAADLHLLRVIDVPQRYADRVPIDDEHAALVAEAQDVLHAFASDHSSWRIHVHVRVGRPDEEIIALAHEARADLIVIGRHGDRTRRHHLLTGNTVEQVLRIAPCTVVVVQDRLYDPELTDQCADCVHVRAESGGESWFCEAHRNRDRPLHEVVPPDPYIVHSLGFGSGGVF